MSTNPLLIFNAPISTIGLTLWEVNSTLVGTRPELNVIAGSNITVTGSDNVSNNRFDLTINGSSGGGGGNASITIGTQAALPGTSTTSAGAVYFTTDSPAAYVFNGNTTAWQSFGPIFPLTPPGSSTNYSQLNFAAGSQTLTDYNDGHAFILQSNGAFNVRGLYKSAPDGTFTVYGAHLLFASSMSSSIRVGPMLRESATGKLVVFGYSDTGSTKTIFMTSASSPTSYTTDALALQGLAVMPWLFYKIVVDASHVTYYVSVDMQNWIQVLQRNLTSDFTTAPDQFGYGASNQSNYPIMMRVMHLYATTP